MDEVSRKVIINEQKNNKNGTPWDDLYRFSKLVFALTHQELRNTDARICDRSLLDLEAYLTLENKTIPKYLRDFPYQETYHNIVFFAPTWLEIYGKDGQRLQEFEDCLALEKSLLAQYQNKGFEIIQLPKISPLERTQFILETIDFWK